MTWRKHFSSVNNSGLPYNISSNDANPSFGAGANRFESVLPEIYAGSPDRLVRYMQYDQMDMDLEIYSALSTIAEFGTQVSEETDLPFEVAYTEDPTDTESTIINESLRRWCKVNDMQKKAFRIFRSTIKYGDQFFIRDPKTYKLYWVDPANVEKIAVDETDGRKIDHYYIKNLNFNIELDSATPGSAMHKRPYGSGQGLTGIFAPTSQAQAANAGALGSTGEDQGIPIDASHVIHITLTEEMDLSWPFGRSVLEPVFKVFKQKELLEDSIIIYRVHRAPERRVFFIDTGNAPPHKARQYLEQVRLEIQQKRLPNKNNQGQSVIDAAYNPMSMLEDYFFAQTSEGRGSKVDTLQGGENLGQIDDLKYFNNKLIRGLGIPSSYLPTGPEDGTATYNDGKVGVAYIQEYRFSKYVERLQQQIQESLDREFKLFLKYKGVELDNSNFNIIFTPPMNFSSYRDLQINNERASLYNQISGDKALARRFKMKKYLELSDDEIKENEKLWREENGYEKFNEEDENGDLRGMGIRPMEDQYAAGDFGDDLTGLDIEGGEELEPGAEGGDPAPQQNNPL